MLIKLFDNIQVSFFIIAYISTLSIFNYISLTNKQSFISCYNKDYFIEVR